MAEVIWTPVASGELDAASFYISEFSPLGAQRIATRIRSAAADLALFPHRGRALSGGRRVLAVVPPFLIIYRIEGDQVFVLRIRHGARRPLR